MEERLFREAQEAREVVREPDAAEAAQVEVVRAAPRGEGLRVVPGEGQGQGQGQG